VYADVNGTKLYYSIIGDGPPIMFMHGGLGFDHIYFRPWVDPLADNFTVIFYDHRGNGRSERPPNLDDVSHATWADDADALRKHLGIHKMTLIGHSYGGVIAQHYALRHQDRLERLILATTYPAWDYTDVVIEGARRKGTLAQVRAIETQFFNHVNNDEDMEEMAEVIASLYFHDPESDVAKHKNENARYSAAAYNHGFIDIHSQHNVVDRLNEIAVPTLVLCGLDDFVTPYEQGSARLHSGIRGSKLVIFEHSAHMIFAEEQEKFLNLVSEFAGSLPRRRTLR
jgi:proline iminopeptidase